MLVKPSSGQLVRTLKDEKGGVCVCVRARARVCVRACAFACACGFYKLKHTHVLEVASGEVMIFSNKVLYGRVFVFQNS
jgi:hypothetical protein